MKRIWRAAVLLAVAAASPAWSAPVAVTVRLSGAERAPPVADQSAATATAELTFDAATRVFTWTIDYSGIRSAVTAVQLRGPATLGKNAGLLVQMGDKATAGVQIPTPITGRTTLTRHQGALLLAGNLYIVLDSTDHPDGELRGQVILPKS